MINNLAKINQIKAMKQKSIGKASIGGPFCLVDHNGIPKSDLHYVEKFKLIYFGFTCCPDICPAQLNKMANVLEGLSK